MGRNNRAALWGLRWALCSVPVLSYCALITFVAIQEKKNRLMDLKWVHTLVPADSLKLLHPVWFSDKSQRKQRRGDGWEKRCTALLFAASSRGYMTCLRSAEGAGSVLTHSGGTSDWIFQGERLVVCPYQRVKVTCWHGHDESSRLSERTPTVIILNALPPSCYLFSFLNALGIKSN